ncbi:hypothetical protein [Fusobacterium hwasookii]|uniref:hypothetical protein n=1 Tax=Fusobacterium hwasookii TaxID=1583098 RepID=UPI0028E26C7F|nr:hypothetical protein [Fusobacterium hwasookii]
MAKIYCSHCEKEIEKEEEFIIAGDSQIYCRDCIEENTFTTYSVGGEVVGDENDTEEYDTIEQFEKSLKDEVKHWESYVEEYEKTDDKNMIDFYKRKLSSAKSRYNELFGEDDEEMSRINEKIIKR